MKTITVTRIAALVLAALTFVLGYALGQSTQTTPHSASNSNTVSRSVTGNNRSGVVVYKGDTQPALPSTSAYCGANVSINWLVDGKLASSTVDQMVEDRVPGVPSAIEATDASVKFKVHLNPRTLELSWGTDPALNSVTVEVLKDQSWQAEWVAYVPNGVHSVVLPANFINHGQLPYWLMLMGRHPGVRGLSGPALAEPASVAGCPAYRASVRKALAQIHASRNGG